MPISEIDGCSKEHWKKIRTIYDEVIEDCGFISKIVSESESSGIIHKNIVTNLFENPIVICDVSCKNPNVMFELGLRIAFDKPVIITNDNETKFSFDIGPIEHLIYPRSQSYAEIKEFKQKLKAKILNTIDNAENFTYLRSFGINYMRVDSSENIEKKLENIERDTRLAKILAIQTKQVIDNFTYRTPIQEQNALMDKLGIKH